MICSVKRCSDFREVWDWTLGGVSAVCRKISLKSCSCTRSAKHFIILVKYVDIFRNLKAGKQTQTGAKLCYAYKTDKMSVNYWRMTLGRILYLSFKACLLNVVDGMSIKNFISPTETIRDKSQPPFSVHTSCFSHLHQWLLLCSAAQHFLSGSHKCTFTKQNTLKFLLLLSSVIK